MPAPIALTPLAWTALRLGAVAAMAFYASRHRDSQPKDAEHARVLDDLPEGVTAEPHRAEDESAMHGTGRFRRTVRFGSKGYEIDAAALGRLRFRRLG